MSLFRTRTIDAGELADWSDVLWTIHKTQFDLLIVENVLPAAICERVVRKLEDPTVRYDWTLQEVNDPKRPQFKLLGESLAPYAGHPEGPDLAHYFGEAARFRGTSRRLFGDFDYEQALEATFAAMGGGRSIVLPRGPAGEAYAPSTIRNLPPGTEIPVHVGNYFITTPACRHLATLVDLQDQLSFFLVLQKPEGGGELVVFKHEWGMPIPDMKRDRRANWDELGDPYPHERFAPATGAMLVFNGGRFYHRVSRVTGTKTRWTIGGFASFSPDAGTILYWS